MIIKKDDIEFSDMWEKIKKTETGFDFSYLQYVEIDKDVQSFESFSDKDIIDIVNNDHENKAEDNDTEDINEQIEVIDKKTMMEYIHKMQMYFFQNKKDCSEYIAHLDKIEKFMETEQYNNQKQTSIDKYLVKN